MADSRSPQFAEEVRASAGGRGLDLVLNSLNGAIVPRSLEPLAAGGAFVEIGKLGSWSLEQVAEVPPDVAYTAFDLAEVVRRRPESLPRMIAALMGAVADGSLPTLPVRQVPRQEVADAFRFSIQARHVGRAVIEIDPLCDGGRDGTGLVQAAPASMPEGWNVILDGLPDHERRDRLVAMVREQVARVLGTPGSGELPTDVDFASLGHDSLEAVELRNRLERGSGRPINATLIFDFPTIERVSDHLAASS